MRKRLTGILALVALVAGGCGSDDPSATTATTTSGGAERRAQTFPIGVDARTDAFASSWSHFFPHELRAHPGDTLEFTSSFTGEPHSLAFGTLIEEYLAANAKLDPNSDAAPPPDVQAVLDKVPTVLNDGAGPDDYFIQAGSQPCYLASEEPPTHEACPKDKQEPPAEITGKERYLNSGFLPDEKAVSVKLSDDTDPGQYSFMCLVHGPEMTGVVTVVNKGIDIPSAAEVATEGQKHLDEFVAKVKPQVEKIQSSTSAQAPVGGFPDDLELPSAGVNVFPSEVAVPAGGKVTWTVDGFHTIAFNAPEDARPWMQFDDTGALRVNPKSHTPAASPPIPDPPPAAAGSTELPQLKVDAGTWDGQGFHSSGQSFSGGQLVYSLAFSNPGTYKYLCLIHPDMEGTVKVT